jgi:hypothetical protein
VHGALWNLGIFMTLAWKGVWNVVRSPQQGLRPGFRIHIDLMRVGWFNPGFDDLKLKKMYSWKFNFYFLYQKLQFTYP